MIPERKMRGVKLVVRQYGVTGDDGQLKEDLETILLVIDSLPVSVLETAAAKMEELIHKVEGDIEATTDMMERAAIESVKAKLNEQLRELESVIEANSGQECPLCLTKMEDFETTGGFPFWQCPNCEHIVDGIDRY